MVNDVFDAISEGAMVMGGEESRCLASGIFIVRLGVSLTTSALGIAS